MTPFCAKPSRQQVAGLLRNSERFHSQHASRLQCRCFSLDWLAKLAGKAQLQHAKRRSLTSKESTWLVATRELAATGQQGTRHLCMRAMHKCLVPLCVNALTCPHDTAIGGDNLASAALRVLPRALDRLPTARNAPSNRYKARPRFISESSQLSDIKRA